MSPPLTQEILNVLGNLLRLSGFVGLGHFLGCAKVIGHWDTFRPCTSSRDCSASAVFCAKLAISEIEVRECTASRFFRS